MPDQANIASRIDHTCLRAEATAADIMCLCREAVEHRFFAVCVNPVYVSEACEAVAKSDVKVVSVVGFPLGATQSSVKAAEAREAVRCGADELDMVVHIGALKATRWKDVDADIRAVVDAAEGRVVKVIIETGVLTREEKRRAAEIVVLSGAAFVKTCTGFGPAGATVDDIRLLRSVVGPDFGIKASGKIRDYESADALLDAGANRIGASSGVAIVEQEILHLSR